MFTLNRKTVQLLSIALFALLLVWGVYTFIVYLGVPAHNAALLPKQMGDPPMDVLAYLRQPSVCGSDDAYFCRGLMTVFIVIGHGLSVMSPVLWYVILSAVVGVVLLAWGFIRHETPRLVLRMRPWSLLLSFVAMIWVLFTVLAYSVNISGNIPIRYFVEPLPQVYSNTSDEALQELKNHFASLQQRGCLQLTATTGNGAGVYEMRFRCLQGAFFTIVLPPLLLILLLFFEFLALGRFLLRLTRLHPEPLSEAVLSTMLGAGGFIVLLWIAAVAGVFVSGVGWGLLIALPLLLWKQSLYWLKRLTNAGWECEISLRRIGWIVGWALLSYIAFNYLSVIRPFPIGWDDLGSYLNRPRLLVSYGHFIPSMAQFQWEYLTALGFLLFGYDSIFAATASMMINWCAGVIAVAAVFLFGRTYLGKGRGALAALLYYSLPLVGHFSFADMKVDNAVFAAGTLSFFAVFRALFPPKEQEEQSGEHGNDAWKWMLIAGLLAGLAFSLKPTSIMVILASVMVFSGVSLHWTASLGMAFLAVPALVWGGALRLGSVAGRILGACGDSSTDGIVCSVSRVFLGGHVLSSGMVVLGCLLIGIVLFLPSALRHRATLQVAAFRLGVFCVSFAAVVLPWQLHNNILLGNIVPHFEMGAPNIYSPTIALRGKETVRDMGQPIKELPPELALDPDHPACQSTGNAEELDRYWGFDKGLGHYLLLPWRTVMNIDAFGYYVTTMPALLLLPLLLLLPFFWGAAGRWLRWLLLATAFIAFQWALLANGVPWYGMGMLLGIVVGLEALIAKAPDVPNLAITSILISASLFLNLSQRFGAFEQQKNVLDYAIGKNSAEAILTRTVPYYSGIAGVALQRHEQLPDRPYVYRIGTFIPYFVPKNLEVIGIADHQMDVFNCLYQERDPELMAKRLRALGFNSIILDTNTATIERNPQGTLHQKYNAIVEFLTNPKSGVQQVVADPEAGIAFFLIP